MSCAFALSLITLHIIIYVVNNICPYQLNEYEKSVGDFMEVDSSLLLFANFSDNTVSC